MIHQNNSAIGDDMTLNEGFGQLFQIEGAS